MDRIITPTRRGGARGRGAVQRRVSRAARRLAMEALQPATTRDQSVQTEMGVQQAAKRVFAASVCASTDGRRLPQSPALEQPLRQRPRRRYLQMIDPRPFTSEEPARSPTPTLEGAASPSTSSCPDHAAQPSPVPSISLSVPSPAQYMDIEPPSPATSGTSSPVGARRTRPLSTAEIGELINFGSEDEDEMADGENADPVLRLLIERRANRGTRMFQELDDPEEDFVDDVDGVCADDVATDMGRSVGTYTGEDHLGGIKPQSMMEFHWSAIPEPSSDYSPVDRREKFPGSESKGPIASYRNPYAAFVAIWDRDVVEHIVKQTNIYAQQLATVRLYSTDTEEMLSPFSRIAKWRDTTVDEMYTYFAIIMAMGIVIKKTYESYWIQNDSIFNTAEFAAYMPLERFQQLNRCVHFNNNEEMPSNIARGDAKLYKLQPILDHCNERFSALFNLDRNISLDESLVLWRGWSNIKQFIRNKAAGVGIKTYEVCDSTSGYLWRFKVHAERLPEGDSNAMPRGVETAIPTLVLKLLEGLEYKGHTVWMDNYYNSPALARYLKAHGFDSVGTVRVNRLYIPTQFANESSKLMAVGQIRSVTSGDVDLVLWQDRACVALLSTYHGNSVSYKNGECKPNVVRDYNHRMGGVDKKDQMLAGYHLLPRYTIDGAVDSVAKVLLPVIRSVKKE